jgi:hypothetical protein
MTYILATRMHAPTLEITYSFLVSFYTFDLWISCWAIIVALMRSFFVLSTQRLFVLSSATSSIGQLLPDSSGGGVRMAACLRLVLVYIIVARLSKDLLRTPSDGK